MPSRNIFALFFIPAAVTAVIGQGLDGAPRFSHTPGVYREPFELAITHREEGAVIRYTTNGSEPNDNSPVFSGTINIADRTGDPNVFSRIRTNPAATGMMQVITWREPSGNVAKGTAIRAAAFKDGSVSPTVSGTFFVFPDNSPFRSLPIVSIISDSMGFFGHDSGIYVPGANYQTGNAGTGNYYMKGDDWERESSFEYFRADGQPVIAQTAGIRIHGGWTRRNPQKTMRVYARKSYGAETLNFFNGPLFHYLPYNTFKRLLLRGGGNDCEATLIRDASAQYMISHLNVGTQAFRSVTVFINGEFWGWHNFRERYDQHYLQRTYGVDPDSVDLLDFYSSTTSGVSLTPEPGDTVAYSAMAAYARNNDLSNSAAMDSMHRLMDVDSYLDFFAVQMYFGNADGISRSGTHHNHKMWRERKSFDANAPAGRDGRFRWLVCDLDQIMEIWGNSSSEPTFAILFTASNPGNELFLNLMKNESVKNSFINRFPDMLNSALHPERAAAVIDSIAASIRPVADAHVKRWGIPSSGGGFGGAPAVFDAATWETQITRLRGLYQSKPAAYRNTVRTYFNAGNDRSVTLVSDTAHGFIKINSITVDSKLPGTNSQIYPWSGTYYANIPITVSGRGKSGYRIDKWLVNGTEFGDSVLTVSLSPDGQYNIEAVFVYDESYINVSDPKKSGRPGPGLSVTHRVLSRSNVAFNFTLPEAGNVQLRVYNIAGKEVGRLTSGKYATGSHQLNWQTGKMAPGVYVYRLKADNRMIHGRVRI
ncbi:MAG: CotH kinase family protein [Chitinispirillia bacterium]|nr:CotH kinase family protein [Chitinispirillia bacterium]MCL2241154.1 CotH kinase family protein [Chitinispirillia bacterium]